MWKHLQFINLVSTQKYFTFAFILLMTIVLCSKLHRTKLINYKRFQMKSKVDALSDYNCFLVQMQHHCAQKWLQLQTSGTVARKESDDSLDANLSWDLV